MILSSSCCALRKSSAFTLRVSRNSSSSTIPPDMRNPRATTHTALPRGSPTPDSGAVLVHLLPMLSPHTVADLRGLRLALALPAQLRVERFELDRVIGQVAL